LTRTMHDCSTEVTSAGGSFVEPAVPTCPIVRRKGHWQSPRRPYGSRVALGQVLAHKENCCTRNRSILRTGDGSSRTEREPISFWIHGVPTPQGVVNLLGTRTVCQSLRHAHTISHSVL
jgi:hypothetical protein